VETVIRSQHPTPRGVAMESSDRLDFEIDIINRALQHDLVLSGEATGSSELVFRWRRGAETVGPQFDDRAFAIDWIADWLAQEVA
jgi:hypothetical protein